MSRPDAQRGRRCRGWTGRRCFLRSPAALAAVVAVWLAGSAAAAWQVTLPLADFAALRTRATVAPEPPATPPAPFTIESDEVEIVAGPASAAVVQTLTLRVLSGDWVAIPLGEAGSWVSADLGGLAGRIDSSRGAGTLAVRGTGEHRVRLESAVAVAADESATRPTWRFALQPPAAAVVTGRITVSPALAERVEEAVFESGGQAQGGRAAGAWAFAAMPARELRVSLRGRAEVPERARLPLRFEAASASSSVLSHTRLAVHATVRARVAQGRLGELRLRLPAGLAVEAVAGGQVAGWKADSGILAVTPLAPAEDELVVELELSGPAAESFAAPLLVPLGAARVTYLVRASLQGDGLLELADPGDTRLPDAAETALAAAAPANPAAGTGAARARLYLVRDAARPPRWRAAWAERTEVLAAQVDRLWVEVAAGEAGRAAYQVWALVRNRGAAALELTPPPGFEMQAASRDGVAVVPGLAAGGGLVVPLLTRDAPQLVHLAGLIALTLPGGGDLAVALPALSAPAARVEVRLLLPGGRDYRLADPTRAATATPPPAPAAAGAGPPPGGLAAHLQLPPSAAAPLDRADLTPLPAGYVEVTAAWSALAASPGPVGLHVAARKEKEPWF
jgi:hypothetical protein